MASYRIQFKRSAARDLAGLPRQDRSRIIARIRALAHDPRPASCEKLSGLERYRLRQGNYRILYEIHDDVLTVMVVKIGHRRDVYRR